MAHSKRERLVLFLDRTVFYGLLSLIAIAAVPYGTVQPWWEGFYECGVFVLTLLWMIGFELKGDRRIAGRQLLLPLLVLFVFVLGAQTLSADPFETKRSAFKLLALTLSFGVLLNHLNSKRRVFRLIHLVIAIGFCSALFGVLRQLVSRFAPGSDWTVLAQASSYAQFVNRNHFAFLMEMTLGLIAGLLLSQKLSRRRTFSYLAIGATCCLTLIFSHSRGGILGLFAGTMFLVLFGNMVLTHKDAVSTPALLRRLRQSSILRAGAAAGLVIILLLGIRWVGGAPIVNRMRDMPAEIAGENITSHSKTRRLDMWRATLPLLKQNWLAGVGLGAYGTAITQHHRASGTFALYQAHNDYLELAVSVGILGLLLVAWFVFVLVWKTVERFRSTRDTSWNLVRCCALAGLFAVAVHSAVDFGLHITSNALVFIALLSILLFDQRSERSRHVSDE